MLLRLHVKFCQRKNCGLQTCVLRRAEREIKQLSSQVTSSIQTQKTANDYMTPHDTANKPLIGGF